MSRFWSSFAAASVGATIWAGSAVAGGFAPGCGDASCSAPATAVLSAVVPSASYAPAPAPVSYAPAPAPAAYANYVRPAPAPVAYAPPAPYPTYVRPAPAPVAYAPPAPNCGAPGYAAPVGYPGGYGHKGPWFGGYRPAPAPICTTTVEWQTTYRTEQRCEETWREVSIPVSRAASVPGACGPGQVCQQDVFRIKVPHCEPRTVTVPVSHPVQVTTCRQPDANSCGVVGQPLEDRKWRDHDRRGDHWDRKDRWDDKSSWSQPRPPIHNPGFGGHFYTGSISSGSGFAPSFVGPTTNYRAARTSLSVDLGDVAAPAAEAVETVAAAPAAPRVTEWLSQ